MTHREEKSKAAFARACKVLVGGVDSPVRAFAAVGGTPPVIARARGARITDIDGNTYIDYVGSYGPAILGHAAEQVTAAVAKAIQNGASFGAPTESETLLAEAVIAAFPSIRKVRFVSSGTEAVMSAVRLARGATRRDKIVKIIGCYHGHSDALLVSAGSGALTLGMPSSPGVPRGATADTLLAHYNDLDAVKAMLASQGETIAAVLVEPVAGNMGVVPPAPGYLQGLRDACDSCGTLLIFDEVMTGFRVAYGGAQKLYGVRPDITTLGKIIGGGLPVGAFGASEAIMANLAPEGPVYQAGTLSGNPVAMAAGLATLSALRAEGFYEKLDIASSHLAAGLSRAAAGAGWKDQCCLNRVASMMTPFFAAPPVSDYRQATAADTRAFAAFFHAMLDEGVYIAPSQYEAMFVSAAHTDADIAATIAAAEKAFAAAAVARASRP
ncbi:MAG: glutamate-1-semialdehyde 2,1-aminomutase [Planctomycetaceae bacterium]|nr:glutamate-1-semialdehyde 2,1-aminomutase [Planctomycetaceae bacterium]